MKRAVARVGGAAIALAGVCVALAMPSAAFAWFRANVIGTPDPFTEPFVVTSGQRVIAALSAVLAGVALSLAALRPERARPPMRPYLLIVAGGALAILGACNVRWAGVSLGIWGWWAPGLHHAFLPAFGALTVAMVGAHGLRGWRALDRGSVALALALGAAYGGFSSLWHCCAPMWIAEDVPWPLAILALTVAAITLASAVAASSVRLTAPAGELTGALLFAVVYPWHTPLWFLHCLLGGAFFVALARRTGSSITPGLFLATAYATHASVPFLGSA